MFGKISTGALSDLEKVTKQAYAMVSIYGLSSKLGNISYYDSQGQGSFTKPYSEDRAKIIDDEVTRIIEEQYDRALKILTENKEKLILLAEKLLEKEVIFKDNLVEIFGKREWESEQEIEEAKLLENEGNTEDNAETTAETSETVEDSQETEKPATDAAEESSTEEDLPKKEEDGG